MLDPATPDFDDDAIADFNKRWVRARWTAWRHGCSGSAIPSLEAWTAGDEKSAILHAPDEVLAQAFRLVFDYSRTLALGASRHFHMTLEIADFARLVQSSTIPCARGSWRESGTAMTVRRDTCDWESFRGCKNLCQWYREAIDGVVMGFGDSERYVRHRSRGLGDDICEDVYFEDKVATPTLRLGLLDSTLEAILRPVSQQIEAHHCTITWMGYSAGTLYYRLQSHVDTPSCRSSMATIVGKLHGVIHRILPDIRLQDVGPVAVFGDPKSETSPI